MKYYMKTILICINVVKYMRILYENPRDDTDEFCRESYGEDNPLY